MSKWFWKAYAAMATFMWLYDKVTEQPTAFAAVGVAVVYAGFAGISAAGVAYMLERADRVEKEYNERKQEEISEAASTATKS